MKAIVGALTGFVVLCCAASAVAESPPPISAFVGTRSLDGVALSPDGRYLAMMMRAPPGAAMFVRDLKDESAPMKELVGSTKDAQLTWCRWTSSTRLLCGFANATQGPGFVYNSTRIMAIDADGKNATSLINDSGVGEGQFQDRILSSTLPEPNTVLVQANQSQLRKSAFLTSTSGQATSVFPAVQELNVVTGAIRERVPPFPPIRNFLADRQGEVRLGWGYEQNSTDISFFVRQEHAGSHDWKLLFKRDAFGPGGYQPLAICVDKPDCLWAMADSGGRNALWRIDLSGQSPPVLEFAQPEVDVAGPVFGSDGRLMGVMYETDKPAFYPVDPKVRSILTALKNALGDTFVRIADSAKGNENEFLVRTSSDVDPGTFYLLDASKPSLKLIGRSYPDLDPKKLPRMQSISFTAADGTTIPGYLTIPAGRRPERLPLIVMPHGGPALRDSWDFDFLRLFLASRGYAVLQVNFRGSGGYGTKWRMAAHQDWGGLSYSDITDGTRWVVRQGIADPAKMCILGWSYGGYAALLGAVRNADLYRCSVSIAGISDLSVLEAQQFNFVNGAISREEIGTTRQKLKDDSPQRHAAEVAMPVLMIHGDMDATSNIQQSTAMDTELAHAHKKHELVVIKDGWHSLSLESERTKLLTSVEHFLEENLGPGAPAPN